MIKIAGHKVYGSGNEYDSSKTIPFDKFTQQIQDAAEFNSDLRAETKETNALLVPITGLVQLVLNDSLEIISSQNVKKIIHTNSSLFQSGDKIEAHIVKGENPIWRVTDGIVYFSQNEYCPLSDLSSNRVLLSRKDWHETEEAPIIVKTSGDNTIAYIDSEIAKRYGLSEWLEFNFNLK